MVTSNNHSPIRVSQKRLTVILSILALLGCLVLGLVWRDSVENLTAYSTNNYSIALGVSCVVYESHQLMDHVGFVRESLKTYGHLSGWPLFARPVFSYSFVRIPIYLLILAYLATLLLIWVVLMNRLARRHFTNPKSIPTKE